ncbi:molybdopterin-dependent oxidoreductase [Dokdonella koreensis]|uniref:Oxidoreductase molybdopterin-binding domain-containing protein n=1 Tax=Dokdonella koreensis DS-123 TaxID=1300342 RepID=A0A160DTI6_9GAMM|nr:molybdopterin-dependent oxidoreductase [Dokdonella koreensis]ANB17514.1 Hypothetical protein I596_1488 [Dokdonella koreensis DS-123]
MPMNFRTVAIGPDCRGPRRRAANLPVGRLGLALALVLAAAVTPVHADDPHAAHRPVAAAAVPAATAIAVGGEVAKPLRLDVAALAALPRVQVKASAHGTEGVWDGVPLVEVLRAAGAPLGETLRGPNLRLYVRIRAADGYRVVFALAELDPKFRDDGVILADRRDGKPLAADEGPFRIIAPREARPGRWVRQVVAIDVLRAPE